MNKDIICVDLTKFNFEKLEEVSTKFNLDLDMLVSNKKRGFAKLFLDLRLDIIIAYTTKKNKREIVYTDYIENVLSEMKPIEVKKEPVQLTVNSVLEKITKYGIDSLSDNEKDFLNDYSK